MQLYKERGWILPTPKWVGLKEYQQFEANPFSFFPFLEYSDVLPNNVTGHQA
jgi:hypothetical protein